MPKLNDEERNMMIHGTLAFLIFMVPELMYFGAGLYKVCPPWFTILSAVAMVFIGIFVIVAAYIVDCNSKEEHTANL